MLLTAALLASWPSQADHFTFAVVGDTQGSYSYNDDVLPQIVADMDALEPALVIFVGDLIGGSYTIDSHQEDWEDWVTLVSQLDAEIWAVPGNHDFFPGEPVYGAWLETFPWLPTDNSPPGEEGMTYHFDYGGSRFVSVLTDSEWGQVSPDQVWLDAVLAGPDAVAADHVFVYSHHPVSFSTAEPLGTTSDAFWQSLVGADVRAYFCGHWHRYQPSQLGAGGDTWETIIGTGGGSYYAPWRDYQQLHGFLLVEVDEGDVTAWFYGDEDGDGSYDDVMDEYVIAWEGEAPTGLVAHYGFEDDALTDDAPPPLGKGVHGELMGAATLQPDGADGGSVQLPGDGGSGVVAGAIGDYNLSINGDLTISLFAGPLEAPSGAWGGALLCYGTADYYSEDEETNYSYWLSSTAGGGLRGFWEHDNGDNVVVDASASASPDEGWHHYAMTRDAATMQARFFVDGNELGEPVSFDHLPTGGGRGMLYMGRDVEGSDAYTTAGRLDELCVFNRVLSDDELSALAAGWDCFFDRDGDGQDDSEGDCDDERAELNTLDVDGDGVTSCDDDCDDSDPDIHPGAEEICDDEIDNDCDGDVDETVCDADTADVSQDDSGDPDGKQDPEGQGAGDCGCGAGLHPSPRALLWLSLGFLALRRRDGGPRR